MIDLLAGISGTDFLIFFSLTTLLCLVIGKIVIINDGSEEYPMPSKNACNLVAISAMRGGWQGVLETVLFQMFDKGILRMEGNSGDGVIVRNSEVQGLSDLERIIYDHVRIPRKPSEMNSTCIKEGIRTKLEPTYCELEQQHLMKSKSDRMRARWVTGFLMACLCMLGGTKLLLGISRNKPIILLSVLMVVAIVLLFKVLKPNELLTSLGRKYIKELTDHLVWMKACLKNNSSGNQLDFDPALGIAVYGVSIVAGSVLFSSYNQVFANRRERGWLGDSTFGDSGDSGSSSSSDGGSGCGGCGGCGGGD